MSLLKERLDGQDSSHGNASMFLQTLKTLMAKLKASDWGALDRKSFEIFENEEGRDLLREQKIWRLIVPNSCKACLTMHLSMG